MAYDLGDIVGLAISVKDASGTAANATAVTCTITLPDGTTATPSVTNGSTGSYTVDYSPTLVGRHLVRWVATGTNASAYTDSFEVNDPADLPVISLDEAKSYLNITSTNSDEEIRQFILEATDIAERLTGRQLRRRTVTRTYSSPPGAELVLGHIPVASVTSISENGTALVEGTDYVVNNAAGIIRRGTETVAVTWAAGTSNLDLVYVVGESTPSPTAQLLVKELTRHLWRTQRGASPMSMGNGDDFIPGSNNIVTYRVRELAELLSVAGIA